MGIEKTVNALKPKQKKLFENIISVLVILTLLYTVISCIQYGNNWMAFLQSTHFMTTAVSLIFLAMLWKILHGGKINIPEQSKTKQQFNIPDTWGVRGQGLGLLQQPKPKVKSKISKFKAKPKKEFLGSWECPKCKSLVIGNKCKCGYELK